MSLKVTPKQAIFAAEYLVDGNAKRAAIAAGFKPESAHVTGARLLKHPKVAAAIADGQTRLAKKLEVTAERVLQELAKLAFYDPGELFDVKGDLIPVHQLDSTIRAAVSSVETERRDAKDAPTVMKRIKLADKGTNLERLGKHLKLFGDSSFGATLETGPGGLGPDSSVRIVFVRPE